MPVQEMKIKVNRSKPHLNHPQGGKWHDRRLGRFLPEGPLGQQRERRGGGGGSGGVVGGGRLLPQPVCGGGSGGGRGFHPGAHDAAAADVPEPIAGDGAASDHISHDSRSF